MSGMGFLTESAILPKKSKAIHVSAGSMMGLKALVYQKEQDLKNRGSEHRRQRGKRRMPVDRRDVWAKKNKGVDDRNKQDEDDKLAANESAASLKALKAKAALYDQIAQGTGPKQNAGFLVDFDQKELQQLKEERNRPISSSRSKNATHFHQTTLHEQSDVQITDVFGRTRTVERGSKAHMTWQIREEREKQQASAEESKKELYSHDMAQQDQREEWEKKAITGTGPEDAFQPARSAVRSQWEKTLSRDSRSHLEEINTQTEAARSTLAEKKSKKERRRELLRAKQQQRIQRQQQLKGQAIAGSQEAGVREVSSAATAEIAAAADATDFLSKIGGDLGL